MYRTILVPLDGSPFAEHAIGTASRMARASGARIELVRVHRTYAFDLGDDSHWDETTRRDEMEYLARTAATAAARADLRVDTAVLDGPIAEAICEHAQELPAPLITLSTHGRTGFSRAWLGSVADAVVRHAASPVLLLRSAEDGPPRDDVTIRELIVALDGSGFSEQILPHALSFAECARARLLLLRIVEPITVPVAEYAPSFAAAAQAMSETTQVLVSRAEEYVSGVAARARHDHPELDIRADVRVSGSAARAIIDVASERHADMIALATHGRGMSRLLLGSVADKVLRGGPGAVLLVRPHVD